MVGEGLELIGVRRALAHLLGPHLSIHRDIDAVIDRGNAEVVRERFTLTTGDPHREVHLWNDETRGEMCAQTRRVDEVRFDGRVHPRDVLPLDGRGRNHRRLPSADST